VTIGAREKRERLEAFGL